MLLAASATAQRSLKFLGEAYVLGIVADAESTQQFERRGYVETWNAALYGDRPSRVRFYSTSFGVAAAELVPAYYLRRSRRASLRWLGRGLEAYAAYETMTRFRAAQHNWSLK